MYDHSTQLSNWESSATSGCGFKRKMAVQCNINGNSYKALHIRSWISYLRVCMENMCVSGWDGVKRISHMGWVWMGWIGDRIPSKSPGQSQQDAQATPTLVALITLITLVALVGVNRMRKQHQPLNTVGDQEVAERECWSLERVLSWWCGQGRQQDVEDPQYRLWGGNLTCPHPSIHGGCLGLGPFFRVES